MKHLIVRNFGPVKNADLELKPYNFFIGSQGVGKSTLAKLICIVSNYAIYYARSLGDVNFFDKLLNDYNVSAYLKSDSYIFYEESKMLKKEDGKDIVYKVEFYLENGDVNSKILENNIEIEDNDRKLSVLDNFFTDIINKTDGLFPVEKKRQEDLKSIINFFLNSFRDSVYVPAERIMFSIFDKLLPALNLAGSSIPRLLLYFSVNYNEAKTEFSNYDIPMFGVSYLHEEDKDYIKIGNTKKLLLSAASSGIQSAIPMLLTLNSATNKKTYHSYVIEEPEINLYPDNQINLLDEILKLFSGRDIESCMTITTHSPYLINYLNVLIRRYKNEKNVSNKVSINPDDLSVYSIDKQGNTMNLMSTDNISHEIVVNTIDLSMTMDTIYNEYVSLDK